MMIPALHGLNLCSSKTEFDFGGMPAKSSQAKALTTERTPGQRGERGVS